MYMYVTHLPLTTLLDCIWHNIPVCISHTHTDYRDNSSRLHKDVPLGGRNVYIFVATLCLRYSALAKLLVISITPLMLQYSFFATKINTVDIRCTSTIRFGSCDHPFKLGRHLFTLEPCCTGVECGSWSGRFVLWNTLSIQCSENNFLAQSLQGVSDVLCLRYT